MLKPNRKTQTILSAATLVAMVIAASAAAAHAQTSAGGARPATPNQGQAKAGTEPAGEGIVSFDKANALLGLPKDSRPEIACDNDSRTGKDYCTYHVSGGPSVTVDPALVDRLQDWGAAGPGTEAALRKYIANLVAGAPDYGAMTPAVAEAVRADPKHPDLGALKSVEFSAGPPAIDFTRYKATYERGSILWDIALDAGGKISKITKRVSRAS